MQPRIITSRIDPGNNKARLVDYLCRRFTYCGRRQWETYIDEGRLLLDGTPATRCQTLVGGQRLEFLPPEALEPAVNTDYSLVYQNSQLIVVNKPPLLPIHPGGRFFAHTLWYLLRRDIGETHIITRLDRETSGMVLVARDAATARTLNKQQLLQGIHKRYLVLVHGCFPERSVNASGWLVPDQQSRVRKKRCFIQSAASLSSNEFGPGPESCETILTGKASWLATEGPRSLVEATLVTGRTHQIRATLFSLGYPVVGDKLYGLDEGFFLRFAAGALSPEDSSRLILPYQALHCGTLDFMAPGAGRLSLTVPAPWSEVVP